MYKLKPKIALRLFPIRRLLEDSIALSSNSHLPDLVILIPNNIAMLPVQGRSQVHSLGFTSIRRLLLPLRSRFLHSLIQGERIILLR